MDLSSSTSALKSWQSFIPSW